MNATIWRGGGKDMSDVFENRAVFGKHPASGTLPTKLNLSARQEDNVHKQIASIPDLIEDTVVRLFAEECQATEESLTTDDLTVISTFLLIEPLWITYVATRTMHAQALTLSIGMFLNQ